MINIDPVYFLHSLNFKVTYLLYKALYVLLNLMKVSFSSFVQFFSVLSGKRGFYPVL